jgi:hypothetical protein
MGSGPGSGASSGASGPAPSSYNGV